jgi:hypothetical protein
VQIANGAAIIVAKSEIMIVPTIAFAIPIPIWGVADSGVKMKYGVSEGIACRKIEPIMQTRITDAPNAASIDKNFIPVSVR